MLKRYAAEFIAFLLVILVMLPPHIIITKYPILLLERFFTYGGIVQIILLALFASYLVYKMRDALQAKKWRIILWTLFSCWFFIQLIAGIFIHDFFLLNKTLHFPIPAMILLGPAYRWEIGFMTILFISTIILSGPAWCSRLCYWGAIDHHCTTNKKPSTSPLPFKQIRNILVIFMFIIAILLRLFNVSYTITFALALLVGIVAVIIMMWLSRRTHKMVHCTMYCPIGTLISYLKFINPFRMYIDNTTCTDCMRCTVACKYDTLNTEDIIAKKPGITCTYCGDCQSYCKDNAIRYKLFQLSPETARLTWIVITNVLYVVFLGIGRI